MYNQIPDYSQWQRTIESNVLVNKNMSGLEKARKERRAAIEMATMKTEINNLKRQTIEVNNKLDAILSILQGSKE